MSSRRRRKVIAGNWKMNMTPGAAKELITDIYSKVKGKKGCDVVVCVPYVDIPTVAQVVKGTIIKVGAQNVHFADKGAYTGEISASMLKECGVQYVIIGHSERRQYFGETDETVNLRTKADKGHLDGQVILMHSIYQSTVDASKELVPWLKSQGYQLVTVSDLLRYKYNTEPQALYYGYTFMELDGGHNAGMQ